MRNNDNPFGGVTVVFGGDFRQVLPVIVKGSWPEIVDACLQKSLLWNYFNIQVLTLQRNMHLNISAEDSTFSQFLRELGNGMHTVPDGSILLPQHMKCEDNIKEGLINIIYPQLDQLSLRNNEAAQHNNTFLKEQYSVLEMMK